MTPQSFIARVKLPADFKFPPSRPLSAALDDAHPDALMDVTALVIGAQPPTQARNGSTFASLRLWDDHADLSLYIFNPDSAWQSLVEKAVTSAALTPFAIRIQDVPVTPQDFDAARKQWRLRARDFTTFDLDATQVPNADTLLAKRQRLLSAGEMPQPELLGSDEEDREAVRARRNASDA